MIDDKKQKIRLGIIYIPFPGWVAYNNYISNLIISLKILDNSLEIILLVDKDTKIDPSIKKFDRVVKIPSITKTNDVFPKNLRKLVNYLRNYFVPCVIDRLCSTNNINVIFSHSKYRPNRKHQITWISWIPDFQHIHLPQLFTAEEIYSRNQGFKKVIQQSDCVIVSSQSAFNDLTRFDQNAQEKSKVVSFVSQINPIIYTINPEIVCMKYDLPEKFIYLPNQFWIHKNHKLVVGALDYIHALHPELAVVCSGSTVDYRNISYFSDLLNEVSKKGLQNNFIVLGLVPRDDVFQLMRQSCAVLQPSLFEGWSTTVEEAKSLGKQLILSDIPVHREQNPPNAIYFKPDSVIDLAGKMVLIYKKKHSGPDQELERIAREKISSRTMEYAMNFKEVLEFAQKNTKRKRSER